MTPIVIASLFGQFFSSAIVSESAAGLLTIISAPGRYAMWVLAFLIVCPLAWFCWRRRIGAHYAPGVFFASFFIIAIVVPGITIESIRVAPDSIDIRTGFWFAPTTRHIPLTQLRDIVEEIQTTEDHGLPRHDTIWEFRYRNAPSNSLNLPDLLEDNRAPVIQYLRAHGIEYYQANPAPPETSQ